VYQEDQELRPLVSPEEMTVADRAAIHSGTPAETLMDRAGRAVARAAISEAKGRYGRRAVVVCGKGSNGGDGFVAARVLKREGLSVSCLSLATSNEYTGAAAEHLERLTKAGGRIAEFRRELLEPADVIVDALFGTGFRGRAEGRTAEAIEAINACAAPVVAVDIPSGVSGDTGAVEGPAILAATTVAMGAEKLGTAVGAGAVASGRVEVSDIGIPVSQPRAFSAEPSDVAAILPRRAPDAHKRSGGSVGLLVGSRGMTGAAVLSARGAVRMGAGYATVGCTAAVDEIVAATLPEVLSTVVTDEDFLGPEALAAFSPILKRAGALASGPGLGQGDRQRALIEAVLVDVDVPVVLDADALNVLGHDTAPLTRRSQPLVVTPHPGELSRLLGKPTSDVERDRVGAARDAAREFGCVVLLKGYRTVVARPDGVVAVNPTGGPSLATAGTGDVLTGAVAALVAAGLDGFEAAWAAAYVHGLAGDLVGLERGAGAAAMDVAETLPLALRRVASGR